MDLPDESILILNDYALTKIFENMNLKDQLNFAASCTRLEIVFGEYASAYEDVDSDELLDLSSREKDLFVKLVAEHLQYYMHDIGAPVEPAMKIITSCTNLGELQLFDVEPPHFKYLKNLKSLDTLFLEISYGSTSDFENLCDILKGLPDLQKLGLRFKRKCNFRVPSLPQLQRLELGFEFAIMTCRLSFCTDMQNLSCLDIYDLPPITLDNIKCITQYCQRIEVLAFSASNDVPYERFCDLPALLHVKLRCYNASVRSEFLNELGKKKRVQLRSLLLPTSALTQEQWQLLAAIVSLQELQVLADLTFILPLKKLKNLYLEDCCHYLTKEHFISILVNFESLQSLGISWPCFDEKVVRELRKWMAAYQPMRRISLYISAVGIRNEQYVNNQAINFLGGEEGNRLLRVIWENPVSMYEILRDEY